MFRVAKFRRPPREAPRYPHDVAQIISALETLGIVITSDEARLAWDSYSDSMCAGWISLPEEPAQILKCIEPYLDITEA